MFRLRLGFVAVATAALTLAILFAVGGAYAGDKSANENTQPAATSGKLEIATFGSGCFWCAESDFDKVKGVVKTISGYMGGKTRSPTYHQVSSGRTGHAEVLQVTFDPKKVSYAKLLDYYWRHTDILDGGGQFCDRGSQYRPVIFVHSPEQKRLALEGKAALDKSGRFKKPLAVEITDASEFTPAETYHQNYYKKNPIRYHVYRYGCGRDQRIKALWGSRQASH